MARQSLTSIASRFCKYLRRCLVKTGKTTQERNLEKRDPHQLQAATALACSGPDDESALDNALNELLEQRLSGLGISERTFSFCYVDLDG